MLPTSATASLERARFDSANQGTHESLQHRRALTGVAMRVAHFTSAFQKGTFSMMLRIAAFAATLAVAASAFALAADEKLSYPLATQNGSGETGTVTIAPTADGKGSVVTIVTKGQGTDPQPVHVHKGPCAKLDPKPAYPLKTLQEGKSETTLADVPVSQLTNGDFSVNVHKSTADVNTYVACGDLAAAKK
jgi:hypothetical protein